MDGRWSYIQRVRLNAIARLVGVEPGRPARQKLDRLLSLQRPRFPLRQRLLPRREISPPRGAGAGRHPARSRPAPGAGQARPLPRGCEEIALHHPGRQLLQDEGHEERLQQPARRRADSRPRRLPRPRGLPHRQPPVRLPRRRRHRASACRGRRARGADRLFQGRPGRSPLSPLFPDRLGNDGQKSNPGYVRLMHRLGPGITYLKRPLISFTTIISPPSARASWPTASACSRTIRASRCAPSSRPSGM